MGTQITVSLNEDEALVLFEALASGAAQRASVSRGAQGALDSIEAQLERVLVEPFRPDYVKLVEEAERRLTDDDREP